MANSSQPQLFSGARGAIEYTDANGQTKALAFATDISVNERISLRPTFVIGSENAVAIDPLAIDVDASIGRIIPVNEATSANRIAAMTAIDLGFEQAINDILTKDALTITIKDTVTGKIIASIKQARFTNRSFSTSVGDVANERYNFVGIYDSGTTDNPNSADPTGYGPGVDS